MIGNMHPAECSKLRCQERYEDLDRCRARCADLRARLESAEAALRFYANEDNWFPGVGINRGLPCSVEADEGKRARAALAAANEGNTG